jgi:hypothetical protein
MSPCERNNLGRFNKQELCSRGHLFSETAVYFPSRPNERVCSKCRIINTKEWRLKNVERARAGYRKWNHEHPEKVKESYRKYYEKNKEKRLQASRERYSRNKEGKKWQIIFRKYGITQEDFNKLFELQKGCCAICGKDDFTQWTLNIDHCHKTGKVRGILCNNCNTAIGALQEDVNILQNAIKYINNAGVCLNVSM